MVQIADIDVATSTIHHRKLLQRLLPLKRLLWYNNMMRYYFFALLAFIVPKLAFAQCEGGAIEDYNKPFRDCLQTANHPGLSNYTNLEAIVATISVDLQTIFQMILVIMVVYYGARAVFLSHTGNHKEVSLSLAYAFGATVIVLAAQQIAAVFTGPSPSIEPLASVLGTIVTILKSLLGIAIVVTMFIQATRLVTSFGTDYMAQARKQVALTIFGAIFVLLAVPIVESIMGFNQAPLASEFSRIINFAAVFFGGLCVIGFMIGGFFYAISVQDSLKDRGQKIMLTTATALLIVVSSWTILEIFF
jgi:hypothetical protein